MSGSESSRPPVASLQRHGSADRSLASPRRRALTDRATRRGVVPASLSKSERTRVSRAHIFLGNRQDNTKLEPGGLCTSRVISCSRYYTPRVTSTVHSLSLGGVIVARIQNKRIASRPAPRNPYLSSEVSTLILLMRVSKSRGPPSFSRPVICWPGAEGRDPRSSIFHCLFAATVFLRLDDSARFKIDGVPLGSWD